MTTPAPASPEQPVHRPGLVGRPVTVLMLLVTIGVLGVIAYRHIPLQLLPNGFSESEWTIRIPVPDSTPREVLEQVTKPLEESLRTIPDITEISSRSSNDNSRIEVSYRQGADADAIYADIRDRVERLLPTFPDGADRYRIRRYNSTSAPIIWASIAYDESVSDPTTLLENVIQPRLEAVPGVARAEVRGLIGRRVDIQLDPDKVRAYGIDVRDLIQRLSADNVVASGGVVRESGNRFLLRVSNRFDSFDTIRAYRINDSLTLGEVAEVGYRYGVREWLVRIADHQQVDESGTASRRTNTLSIYKNSEANTVETCERVERFFEEELARDPRLEGFVFRPFWSDGKMIQSSVNGMQQTAMWGGLFAILVLYVFLRRVRITLVVAAAIPLSLLIAVVLLFFQGATFNLASLSGLTLALGMLIDNAIVIAENIYRMRQLGHSRIQAAVHGSREVALAVTLGTLTTVAVFLPLMLLGGESQMQVFIDELGYPVCFSLLASLFVAMVFIPVATIFLGAGMRKRPDGNVDSAPTEGFVLRTYRRLLEWHLAHRLPAVLIWMAVIYTVSIPSGAMEERSGSAGRTSRIGFSVEFPPAFTLREANDRFRDLQEIFVPMHEELDVRVSLCWFSRRGGSLNFFLEPDAVTTRSAFMEALKPHMPEWPGVQIKMDMWDEDRSEESRMVVEARGRDPLVLTDSLEKIARKLEQLNGVNEVTTARDESTDEIRVEVLRERAQRYGVNPDGVARLVSWALRGAPLSDYQTSDEELPMWIAFAGSDMENIADLYSVQVWGNDGQRVALDNLARFDVGKGLPSIRRRDGKVRQWMQVMTDKNVDHGKLRVYVQTLATQLDLPEGYEVGVPRGNRDATMRDLFFALGMGLLFILVLMAVLFESVFLTFAVLPSLFFLYTGAIWSMWILGEPMRGDDGLQPLGFLILVGVVVNNGIVLIDCINRFRSYGRTRTEAIIEAGKARLRPIFMTAATTICGLMPMVVIAQTGEGLDYRPLAVVVLGGLTLTTMATPFAVPLVYSLLDDLRHTHMGLWSRLIGGANRAQEPQLDLPTAP